MEEENHQVNNGTNGITNSDPYDEIKKKKIQLLQALPPVNHENVETQLEDSLNVYLGLVKQGKNYNNSLRNNKNFSSVDFTNNTMSNFDIEDYGSNFSPEVFNIKATITDDDFFDHLIRKQAELQGFIQPRGVPQGPAAQSLANKEKKSLWDATADPTGDETAKLGKIGGFVARYGAR